MNRRQQSPPEPRPSLLFHADRRSSMRYPGKNQMAWVGWWEPNNASFTTSPAWILDISQTGLLVETPDAPKTEEIWVSIITQSPSDWLPADLVDARPAPDNPVRSRLRIAIHEPLPYELFKVAALGVVMKSDDEVEGGHGPIIPTIAARRDNS